MRLFHVTELLPVTLCPWRERGRQEAVESLQDQEWSQIHVLMVMAVLMVVDMEEDTNREFQSFAIFLNNSRNTAKIHLCYYAIPPGHNWVGISQLAGGLFLFRLFQSYR